MVRAKSAWQCPSRFGSDLGLPPSSPAPPAAAHAHEDAIRAEVLAALNADLDAAEKLDPRTFARFSRAPDVRFVSQGASMTVPEFLAVWETAMKHLSRQSITDRRTTIQVLSPDIAVSTTQAKYMSVDAHGVTSSTVPYASTDVWQRHKRRVATCQYAPVSQR